MHRLDFPGYRDARNPRARFVRGIPRFFIRRFPSNVSHIPVAHLLSEGKRPLMQRMDTQTASILPPGTVAPDFVLGSLPGQTVSLRSLRGKPVVLVFYPADWSPVCGDQLALYNEISDEFRRYDATVLPISVDSVWCHAAYALDHHLEFT